MQKLRVLMISSCAFVPMGCSYVPSLEQASGAETGQTNILISDVVKRVKCELADSFDDKLGKADYQWLENWTAKVDLTLQVSDSAGLAPSVSYTKFYRNDFNYAAGSTSLTSNAIAAVQRTLTLTGGANFSEQAQRAETITFTLSLTEVKTWKAKTDRSLRRKFGAAVAEHFCDATGREFRGYLGLKEWIESALYPVTKKELQAGIHPQNAGATKPPSPTPKSSALAFLKVNPVPIAEAKARVDAAAKQASASAKGAAASQAAVDTAFSSAQTAMQTTIAPYLAVLTDELKQILANNLSTLKTIQGYVKIDADGAETANAELQVTANDVDTSTAPIPPQVVANAETSASDAAKFETDAKKQQDKASKIADAIVKFQPNPPIDGLLHSVQFVVNYGASITPNWSLLLWKGPGLTIPGASLSGVKTNILNIALGPTSEQNRLIQNQTVVNAAAHP